MMPVFPGFVWMKAEPSRNVFGGCLEHILPRCRAGTFQSVQDSTHQHEPVLAIMTAKGSKGLRRGPLVGLGHQVEFEVEIKVDFNGRKSDERPCPPRREVCDYSSKEIHTAVAD